MYAIRSYYVWVISAAICTRYPYRMKGLAILPSSACANMALNMANLRLEREGAWRLVLYVDGQERSYNFV